MYKLPSLVFVNAGHKEKGKIMVGKKFFVVSLFLLFFLFTASALECDFIFSRSGDEPLYGMTYRFDARKSDTSVTSYGWVFGDGVVEATTDPIITHTYEEAGNKSVSLTCSDDSEEKNIKNKSLTVYSYPKAIIEITTPLTGSFPMSVSFDCSNSTDADGAGFTCYWASNGQVSYDMQPTFNYHVPGTYTVKLMVTKKSSPVGTTIDRTETTITLGGTCATGEDCPPGYTCQDGECVSESATGPVANFYFTPQNPKSGEMVSFDASISEPGEGGEITNYGWAFGDNSTGTGATAEHSYETDGTYPVTLTVTGSSGKSDIAIKHVKVGTGIGPMGTTPQGTTVPEGESELIIVKSKDRVIDFDDDEEQREITVKWTVFNIGSRATLQNVVSLNCSQNLSCAITNFEAGTALGGNDFIVLEQSVLAKKPNPSEGYDLGLKVTYTDSEGNAKEKESSQPLRVELTGAGKDRFHVKLDYSDQNFCIGFNGVFGRTGERAKPRVLLSWDWVDFGLNACDKESGVDDEFLYCDPTQFSIELARKLHEIEELEGRDVDSLTSFKAFLIADNYSDDFQKDFVYYYANSGFFEVPEWFSSDSTPWNLYFSNPERLEFSPRELPESGLYNVSISVDNQDFTFFDESNQPNAVITVSFELEHPVGVEVPDSPFYHLPFNGLVGTLREDEDNKIERKGYGLGFINESGPIALGSSDTEFVETVAVGGENYSTSKYSDFLAANLSRRGQLLTIDLDEKSIEFSPSSGTAIITGIKSHDLIAESFYSVAENSASFGAGNDFLSYWTGFATSPLLSCRDYYSANLPDKRQDLSAASFDQCCVQPDSRENSFGFLWENIDFPGSLFLKSVFYTPVSGDYALSSSCGNDSFIFASNSSTSTTQSELIQLGERDSMTVNDIIELIGSKDVCVHSSGSAYEFYWNEQKLGDSAKEAESWINSKWSINLDNFKCEDVH